jgi:hypothetical protein
VLNNNTLQNIQLINLANGNNNNKLECETDTDKPVNLSVPESGRRRFSKSEGQENKFRNRKMLLLRRPNGDCRAVCETNNPQVRNDNSALGGGKEQHIRAGQSRGVGNGTPHTA